MLWIDKNQLDFFAQTNMARRKLPRMVSELILATSQVPDAARFLADEAGEVRGFDAVLVSPGAAPYIPQGKSIWEFGVSADIETKARKSVEKRTEDVADEERRETTLICVTPLHYDNPRKLLHELVVELSSGRGWKELRILDGAQLKGWLELAPGVAAKWARTEMQAYPSGVLGLDEFWEHYASAFSPLLNDEVLLAGRRQQADELVLRLSKLQPDRIPVSADSPGEALAFVAAAVRSAKPDVRLVLEARSIVVETQEAARDLRDKSLVFLPSGAASSMVGFLSQRGPTILAVGRNDALPGAIDLRRPTAFEFGKALETMDLPRARATQLATECGRSVTVLGRRIPSGRRREPEWASRAALLVTAFLVGAWDSTNEHDKAVVVALSGYSEYEAWQATIQPFLKEDDPPLEHEGTVWKVRAPVDVLEAIGALIEPSRFDAFAGECRNVFSDRDGNIGKSAVEAMTAGRRLKHSNWLREGMANALLLIATMSEAAGAGPALASRGGAQVWVDGFVGTLPGLASDTGLLISLRGQLPLLAEAAPRPFVFAIEKLLREKPDDVRALLLERTEFISPVSDHLELLWALEGVAWDADLLPRVVTVLTEMDAMDPGGKIMNRPIRSLREILLPWMPHTNADVSQRIGCIRLVAQTSPAVGWKLSVMLLPERHGFSSMTHRPRYREAGANEGLAWGDVCRVHEEAASQVLGLVGSDDARWATLIEHFPVLSDDHQARALVLLDAEMGSREPGLREPIWRELNRLHTRHAGAPDFDWTLKGDRLVALKRSVERWRPLDLIVSAAILFDELGAIDLYPSGHEVDQGAIASRKRAALQPILDRDGPPGLLDVAGRANYAWDVGRHSSEMLSVEEAFALSSTAFESDDPKLREFGSALSSFTARRCQSEWQVIVSAAARRGARPEDVATMIMGLPDGVGTWDMVEALGDEIVRAYWRARPPLILAVADASDAGVERVVSSYLNAGNPWAALSFLDDAKAKRDDLVGLALDGVLDAYNSGDLRVDGLVQYRLERVFNRLRDNPGVDRADLARREFAFLPFLVGVGSKGRKLALFDILAGDPKLFIDFVSVVFRANSAPQEDLGEDGKRRWRAAYNVLESFRLLPGLSDGRIDPDVLKEWVKEALRLAEEADRLEVGALCVGKILAHAPIDQADGAWPPLPVRETIEEIASDDLDRSIGIERFNMRGVFTRGMDEGGAQERAFARTNRKWRDDCLAWPRTSALLGRLADEWDRQADHADLEARQRRMRE